MDVRSAATSRAAMALLFALVLVLILVLMGTRVLGAEPVRGDMAGFHHQAETDRDSYEEGDPVRLTFTVCRTRPWPAVTSSSGMTQVLYDWRVLDDDGEVVADNLHAVRTLELFSVWWLPGQCRSGHDDWDQRYWNREDQPVHGGALLGVPQRGERVEPGTYRFKVRWHTARGGDPSREQPPVLSPPFRVEP
ncbi:MAG TPA: hypothetical protein VM287_10390 [Egibacteraceae bacterium]|nr:hypothetical protein [Egibacteraceae bacterium]